MSDDEVELQTVPGTLSEWLAANIADCQPPFLVRTLTGGNSNVTLLLHDGGGRSIVMRRPPTGEALATAHDILREARIMAALSRAGAPVPRVLAVNEDTGIVGAPFAVMEYVEGLSCHTRADAGALSPAARLAAGASLARALAALHALDVDAIGLGRLGRRQNYVARQLQRWQRQVDADRQRPTPDLDAAGVALAASIPEQRRTTIVHGDVRLDNCILSPSGEVRSIVDWEICALGDPMADLGILLAYWARPGDDVVALNDPPTLAEDFADRQELVEVYLRASHLPAETDVSFYVAFAWWKLSCIVEGVWARATRKGQQLPRPLDSYAEQAARLARQALELATGG